MCVGDKIRYVRLGDLQGDVQAALREINYSDPVAVERALEKVAAARASTSWEQNLEFIRILEHIKSSCITFKQFQVRLGLGRA